MNGILDDVRFALRVLRKSPGFTLAAVLVLGLGIAANTTVYSFLDALILRPFSFEKLDELVTIWETQPGPGRPADAARDESGHRSPLATGDYLDLRESEVFEGVAAYRYRDLNISDVDRPERVRGVVVTSEFFPILRAGPALGRAFLPEDESPGSDRVAVLSHALWRDRFASDPRVIGRTCTLNGLAYAVIGVMPPDFDFPLGGVDLWLPMALGPREREDRGTLSVLALARLADGVSLDRAAGEVDALAARLAELHPGTNAGRGAILLRLAELQVGFTARFAILFQAGAAFVLLITCANMANLVLSRSAGRSREIALRSALGAGRWRIARQLLVENLVLSFAGAALAIWLAGVSVELIRTSVPADIVQWVGGWSSIRVDGRVLALTFGLAALTGMINGLVPVRHSLRTSLSGALRRGGKGAGAPERGRLHGLLVAGEVGLALVLLTGAGLMVRGFLDVAELHQGIDPEGVTTMRIALPEERYPDDAQRREFYRALLERLEAIPDVESASLVSHLPADLGPIPGGSFEIEGRPAATPAERPVADFQQISPGYFRSLRIPLRGGRAFDERDRDGSPPVAIVSESFARKHWPGEDPSGRRLRLGAPGAEGPWLEVVGVVGDVRQYWFDRLPRATLYLPEAQRSRAAMWVIVRSRGSSGDVIAAARAQIARIDPSQPIFEIRTMPEVIRQSVSFVKLSASMMTVLAALALLLSALGVYAVIAHLVSRSTHEMGVRLAVGASPREIGRLVLMRALKPAAAGVAIGLPLAVALGRLMAGALYGIVRPDPWLLAAAALGLLGLAAVASVAPVRRAAAVDPIITLRSE